MGFDFPYGFPQGFARSLGMTGEQPWKAMWQELQRLVVDGPDNRNNRFDVAADLNSRCVPTEPGPFWGYPAGRQHPVLEGTSPRVGFPYPVTDDLALSSRRCTEQGLSGAQEVWKLWGRGCVGSQALVGIPVVAHLRFATEFQAVSQVWPFETGFTSLPTPVNWPFIVHAEIWPGIVPRRSDPNIIKDQAQVRDVTAWLSELDEAGTLGQYFDRPAGLPEEGIVAAITEEGWIVGHQTYGSTFV